MLSVLVITLNSNAALAEELKDEAVKITFKDVDETDPNLTFIKYLIKEQLIAGFPDGTFRTNEALTRAQVISLISRLSHAELPEIEALKLEDMDETHWAAAPIAVGLDTGMVFLKEDGGFEPNAPFTRSEIARALAMSKILFLNMRSKPLEGKIIPRKGTVEIKKTEEHRYVAVEEGQPIKIGYEIKTKPSSIAEIVFPDGTGIFIKDEVQMTIREMKGIAYIKKDGSKGTAVDRFEFDLDKGKIFFILSQSYRGIYKMVM